MKISVIIPVYNASKYLKRCLDSIKNQTYSNWEAICVDDGSTDNSLDILNEYASKDSRFKVIAKSNGGVSDARNVGMDNVTGDYVMYVDSDDFIHHQTMELACAFVKRDGSDIISWYKDTEYSKKLKKHFKYEGCENDELLPSSFF
jgi:Glycosyltransferases involved in cell wall biogenesis